MVSLLPSLDATVDDEIGGNQLNEEERKAAPADPPEQVSAERIIRDYFASEQLVRL